ncbi:hypothetical protein SCUCBS95973_002345 [Sporothrix curviconia]|uniref:Xylanolytic transcriptional activator regulatory domain-containing protein n=1 Tax=Sporothrix curviconia TaxID=1260050 RepID=A0ABP0B629_9PEZI
MASMAKTKNKRSSRACDRCYKKACRCYPGIEGTLCTRCTEDEVACTYSRQVKRRGPRARRVRNFVEPAPSITVETAASEPAVSLSYSPPRTASTGGVDSVCSLSSLSSMGSMGSMGGMGGMGSIAGTPVAQQPNFAPSTTPTAYDESIISPALIERLTSNFYNASYPTRPYFHWPTFRAQIQAQAYRSDSGLYVVAMAVCAVSAARMAHGLTMPSDTPLDPSQAAALSARCYAAATKALPTDLAAVTDDDHGGQHNHHRHSNSTASPSLVPVMKASALLASVCLQNSDLKRTLAHLGYYVSLSVLNGFYSEANWPAGLTEIQRQERRRLFWGVYQQEQYVSNDFGLVSRQREAQATVRYPAEVFCDEDITATSVHIRPDRVSFLAGWNVCTNLYRLLENMHSAVRARQGGDSSRSTDAGSHSGSSENDLHAFLARFAPPAHFAPDSLQFITKAYAALPPELKLVRAGASVLSNRNRDAGGDESTTSISTSAEAIHADRCSIIACNVLVTTQILKMLLVGTGEASVHQRCAIAGELLDELSGVPLAYFHATSMSSLRHLAHVGHMLASVIQRPLPAWTYLQVHSTLRVLADFLEKIESTRGTAPPTPHLSVKLRGQMARIDQCMRKQQPQQPQQLQQAALKRDLTVGQTLLQHWLEPQEKDREGRSRPNALNSPPQSVSSSARPLDQTLDFSSQRLEMDQQQQQQQQQQQLQYHLLPTSTQPPQHADAVFRDTAFDFLLPSDHHNPDASTAAFPLDPLENWPLTMCEPDNNSSSNSAFGLDMLQTAAAAATGAGRLTPASATLGQLSWRSTVT